MISRGCTARSATDGALWPQSMLTQEYQPWLRSGPVGTRH